MKLGRPLKWDPDKQTFDARQRQLEQNETRRLIYVAATRARDLLVLTLPRGPWRRLGTAGLVVLVAAVLAMLVGVVYVVSLLAVRPMSTDLSTVGQGKPAAGLAGEIEGGPSIAVKQSWIGAMVEHRAETEKAQEA